jgi:hypothetical protein
MNEISLGVLRPVDPRTRWPHKAADFPPWLAHPDNIQRLGEAIGPELEVEHTEVAVGLFAADLLARDSATGNHVVIENQLNHTDHDHLGESLTCAAVQQRMAVPAGVGQKDADLAVVDLAGGAAVPGRGGSVRLRHKPRVRADQPAPQTVAQVAAALPARAWQ